MVRSVSRKEKFSAYRADRLEVEELPEGCRSEIGAIATSLSASLENEIKKSFLMKRSSRPYHICLANFISEYEMGINGDE